jgi:hypothetical protein
MGRGALVSVGGLVAALEDYTAEGNAPKTPPLDDNSGTDHGEAKRGGLGSLPA